MVSELSRVPKLLPVGRVGKEGSRCWREHRRETRALGFQVESQGFQCLAPDQGETGAAPSPRWVWVV